jgi:pyridoxamine 5'-phosphate oxidase
MPGIPDIRKEYKLKKLTEDQVATDPFAQFGIWWKEAETSGVDEANAMTLATASSDGIPAARIVLLKGFDQQGFVFYSNYDSFKGKQLTENPRACLVFFWKELERQVRITGISGKLTAEENNEYFRSRPEGSRIAAWASPQSQAIPGRDWLDTRETEFREKFRGKEITRPPHWGGYRVRPITVEFWQGRPNRLHDRLQYSLDENGSWILERLAP